MCTQELFQGISGLSYDGRGVGTGGWGTELGGDGPYFHSTDYFRNCFKLRRISLGDDKHVYLQQIS